MTPSKSSLEHLSFLIGDWRGKGEMKFGDKAVEFNQNRRVRMTPDGSRIEIVAFTDSVHDEMFNGEHSFIFIDSGSGELRLKRQWFLDSGFDETVERVEVDGESVKLDGIRNKAGSTGHRATIRRIGNSELILEGEVIAGERRLPYRVALTKRVQKGQT